MGLMKYLKKFNESSDPNDIKVGDIVLAQTYVGAPKGFEDLKYEVTEVFFDEMENNWKAKLKGIDWVGKNIYFSLDRLKKTSEVNESKREKIFLNGYEMWLDRDKLMLYDKESSEKGIPFDVAGEGDGIYIFSNHLTADEKRQLTDYLKYRR